METNCSQTINVSVSLGFIVLLLWICCYETQTMYRKSLKCKRDGIQLRASYNFQTNETLVKLKVITLVWCLILHACGLITPHNQYCSFNSLAMPIDRAHNLFISKLKSRYLLWDGICSLLWHSNSTETEMIEKSNEQPKNTLSKLSTS